jgi:hypothetical protein
MRKPLLWAAGIVGVIFVMGVIPGEDTAAPTPAPEPEPQAEVVVDPAWCSEVYKQTEAINQLRQLGGTREIAEEALRRQGRLDLFGYLVDEAWAVPVADDYEGRRRASLGPAISAREACLRGEPPYALRVEVLQGATERLDAARLAQIQETCSTLGRIAETVAKGYHKWGTPLATSLNDAGTNPTVREVVRRVYEVERAVGYEAVERAVTRARSAEENRCLVERTMG